jgi:hypothetical protein
MVAKFNPTRFGRRKVFFPVSHVPSPTCNVLEEYELLPGGASCGEGDMMIIDHYTGLDWQVRNARSVEESLRQRRGMHHAVLAS